MNFLHSMRELYQQRSFVWKITCLQLRIRYKVAALGFLWSLLRPLFLSAVLYLVFIHLLRFPQMSGGMPSYATFIVVSMLPWSFFSSALFDGLGSILGNSSLLKKIALPMEVFPLTCVFANLINFLLSLAVVLPALVLMGTLTPSWSWLMLIPLSLHLFLFAAGLVCLLSVFNVFYRDIGMIMEVIITAWFYVTPIFYPASFVLENAGGQLWLRRMFLCNPMFPVIEKLRWCLMGADKLPKSGISEAFSWQLWAGSLAVSIFVFWAGITVVRRSRTKVIDFL
jgi:ABC-type polysaccharide/polyol phosphate export permease